MSAEDKRVPFQKSMCRVWTAELGSLKKIYLYIPKPAHMAKRLIQTCLEIVGCVEEIRIISGQKFEPFQDF